MIMEIPERMEPVVVPATQQGPGQLLRHLQLHIIHLAQKRPVAVMDLAAAVAAAAVAAG